MRRLPIVLLRAAASAFVALAIAIAVLWPIGFQRAYVPVAFHVGVAVIRGGVYAVYDGDDLPAWPPTRLDFAVDPGWSCDVPHEWIGFGAGVADDGEGRARVPAPAAIVALVGAAFAAWRLAGRLCRASVAGRCASCGYDLRASPTRCPECGTVAAVGATT